MGNITKMIQGIGTEAFVQQERSLVIDNVIATRGSFQLGPVDTIMPFSSITVLVGANGAGKTTLTRVLLGQIPLNHGNIILNGDQINSTQASWRSIVGYMPDDPDELLVECTAEEFWLFSIGINVLRFSKDMRSEIRTRMIRRAHEFADLLHFRPSSRQPIAEFSLGMRKKTQLIAALATEPDIIIMDEPRNGLDPIGIEQLHRLLKSLVSEGKLVLVATHDLSWAIAHSQQVIALSDGKMALAVETKNIRLNGGESYLLEKLL